MGKLQLMLQKQQAKINEIGRNWDYRRIYEFKLKKYNFNLSNQDPQTLHTPLHTPYMATPQVSLAATSPLKDDLLQISNDEPEFDSADNSDTEIIKVISQRADCDKLLDDICTTHHCTKAYSSAQCNDPVHNTQVFTPDLISTPVTGAVNTKRPLSPVVLVQNLPPNNFCDPTSEVTQNPATQSCDQLPQEITEPDFHTGEYWVKYDKHIHTRDGHNTLKIKIRDPTMGFII